MTETMIEAAVSFAEGNPYILRILAEKVRHGQIKKYVVYYVKVLPDQAEST